MIVRKSRSMDNQKISTLSNQRSAKTRIDNHHQYNNLINANKNQTMNKNDGIERGYILDSIKEIDDTNLHFSKYPQIVQESLNRSEFFPSLRPNSFREDHLLVNTAILHSKIDNVKSEIFESQKQFFQELQNLKVKLLAF